MTDPPEIPPFPTEREIMAYQCRAVFGLKDHESAERMGLSRQTVCRLRGRFDRKMAAWRKICGPECPVVELWTGGR